MKTLLYGMGLLILTILAVTALIWAMGRLMRRLIIFLSNTKELRKSWKTGAPLEIRLKCDVFRDVFDVQVRKKRWRLLKNSGWKYVNQYVKGDPILDTGEETDPELCWKRIFYKVGFNQFAEEELLKSMIKTYGDLDGYYMLRSKNYKQDMKSWSTDKWIFNNLLKTHKNEEAAFTPAAGGGLKCM